MRKQANRALARTNNGKERDGLAEAGFRIDLIDGKIVLGDIVDNIRSSGDPDHLDIAIDLRDTIAILHTHGIRGLPTPSVVRRYPGQPVDVESRVPNFVMTTNRLYVTVPRAGTYIQLEGPKF